MANCKRNKRKKNINKEISYKKYQKTKDIFDNIVLNQESFDKLRDAMLEDLKIKI